MGWSGGTELMTVVIEELQKICLPQARQRFYAKVIKAFMEEDWDTENECLGLDPSYDRALKQIWKKQGIDPEDMGVLR